MQVNITSNALTQKRVADVDHSREVVKFPIAIPERVANDLPLTPSTRPMIPYLRMVVLHAVIAACVCLRAKSRDY